MVVGHAHEPAAAQRSPPAAGSRPAYLSGPPFTGLPGGRPRSPPCQRRGSRRAPPPPRHPADGPAPRPYRARHTGERRRQGPCPGSVFAASAAPRVAGGANRRTGPCPLLKRGDLRIITEMRETQPRGFIGRVTQAWSPGWMVVFAPGSRCGMLAVRPVTVSEPSMKARATSDRRRLRDLAYSRRRLNAWSMSRPRRSASLPLACSRTTRLFSAVCSCSLMVSDSRLLTSYNRLIVAHSALLCH